MMLPIGMAVIVQIEHAFGKDRSRSLAISLMLAIAYGASVGGCATLVGTPTNLAFASIYKTTFPDAPAISFGQWFLFGLPLAIVLLGIVWIVLTRVFWRVDGNLTVDRTLIKSELAALGPMGREEATVLGVFSATALLWIFRSDLPIGSFTLPGWNNLAGWLHHANDGTVAITMALLLFLIPAGKASESNRLLEADVFQRVPWGIILLFGGGFALAAGFMSSGLSQHLADQFGSIEGVPPWLIVGLVCLAINFLTELTSNTATAQMFLPVLAAWSVGHGVEPLYIMIPATISASMAFMLPVATPPNAIVFGGGRVGIRDMVRTGFFLNIISVILATLLAQFVLPSIFSFTTP
jgi:sodium-dependent dicarboxylate transporter 2/3/5